MKQQPKHRVDKGSETPWWWFLQPWTRPTAEPEEQPEAVNEERERSHGPAA